MGCSSNTGDLPGPRLAVLRGHILFSGRSGRVRVLIRLCRAPYFSLFIIEHPQAATRSSLSRRGSTFCFLTAHFRQYPELHLSCLNKPGNATSVFIRWKSVWCALTGGLGRSAPASNGQCHKWGSSFHTSAPAYLLGSFCMMGNGKAKLPSSLKLKNLECARHLIPGGRGGATPRSNRTPREPEVTDYWVEVTPG